MNKCLILILSITIQFYLTHSRNLIFLQHTFRNGAVSSQNKNNSHLSKEGVSMMYLLGTQIYSKYWELITHQNQITNGSAINDQNLAHDFVYAKSVDNIQCLQSASAYIYGLLQNTQQIQLQTGSYIYSQPAFTPQKQQQQQQTMPNSSWPVFSKGSSFHPFPVHSQKIGSSICDNSQYLTNFYVENCPTQNYWVKENLNSDAHVRILRDSKIKKLLEKMENVFKKNVQFFDVSDYKYADQIKMYLNQQREQIFTDAEYSEMINFIRVYSLYLQYFGQQQQIKVISTNFWLKTLNNLQQSIKNINKKVNKKLVIQSGTDGTITMILSSLNMASIQCITEYYLKGINNKQVCIVQFPQFSSNIAIQLWQISQKQFQVSILYNGENRKLPICNNKLKCPYQQFKNWILQQNTVDDPNQSCGLVSQNKVFYAIVFVMCVFILFLGFSTCVLLRKLKKIDTVAKAKKQGYIQNFQERDPEVRSHEG